MGDKNRAEVGSTGIVKYPAGLHGSAADDPLELGIVGRKPILQMD
jgi:hypothetical protein